MRGFIVCLNTDGSVVATWERNDDHDISPFVEVDDVAYYYEDRDGNDYIYRKPAEPEQRSRVRSWKTLPRKER